MILIRSIPVSMWVDWKKNSKIVMKFSEFMRLAHSESGAPSSKRLYGAIIVVTVQLCIMAAVVLAFVNHFELSIILKELLEVDLITGASLLGLNSVTKIFTKKDPEK